MFFNDIIKPTRLKKGDTLGIVTVSAPEAAENPDRVKQGVRYLEQMGFNVHIGPNALSSNRGHLASDPRLLADDLNMLFADDGIAGVLCTGGGTNANRLLTYIDYENISKHPKVFVGLSNPTLILNAVTARTKLMTYSGPVLVWNFGADSVSPYTIESFTKTLMSIEKTQPVPKKGEWRFLRPGQATGRLYGGNLWSLQSLLGTPYEPDWSGAILFWEDIAKEPKRLDAILTHFKLAGVFEKIAGMIIGDLVLCDAQGPSLSISDIVTDLTAEYDFPILSGVMLGHTEDKLTLPIGAMASFSNNYEDIFRIEESTVN